MKRPCLALAAFALPFAASASPELAEDWGLKAGELREQTAHYIADMDSDGGVRLPGGYERDITRFAATAARLGAWIDGSGGPSDLGCIFRGMAEEGEVQLDALDAAESAAARRDSLKRLATMFSDAESIALAAVHRAENPDAGAETSASSGMPATCAASARGALKALDG